MGYPPWLLDYMVLKALPHPTVQKNAQVDICFDSIVVLMISSSLSC